MRYSFPSLWMRRRFVTLAVLAAAFVAVGTLLMPSTRTLADPDEQKPDWPQWGPALDFQPPTANISDSTNLDKVTEFLVQGRYKGWPHDPYIRPTGDIYKTRGGDLIDGMTHHRVRIYYSPSVAEWLKNKRQGGLRDGSMIVKEMYKSEAPFWPNQDPVIGWAAMVKNQQASHGGWYWVIYFKKEYRTMATVGEWSYSYCLTCHASTESENTFSDLDNLEGKFSFSNEGRSTIPVADPLFPLSADSMTSEPTHLTKIDPAFEALYTNPAIYPRAYWPTGVPRYRAEDKSRSFPSTDHDHVWNLRGGNTYITSDNCSGCHDATLLVETEVPNMLIEDPASMDLLNTSVYGEWRSSPMGMAGRDPIFFAQLQSEMRTYGEVTLEMGKKAEKGGKEKEVSASEYIQNLCLSCHGAMGQRQYHMDGHGKLDFFTLDKVFATGENKPGMYGALAREGISCMICHQMDPQDVHAKHPVNTGRFSKSEELKIFGPTEDTDPGGAIRTWPMKHALGLEPTHDSYIRKSAMCGTCHTIELPVLAGEYDPENPTPVKERLHSLSRAHEQDTYSEWVYSAYNEANEHTEQPIWSQRCQDCHMRSTYQDNPAVMDFKLANVQNTSWPIPKANNLGPTKEITVPTRKEFNRHTFFGMNLFVLHMYDQFTSEIFGLGMDPNVPMGAVSSQAFAIQEGEWQIRNRTADIEVVRTAWNNGHLEAQVRVTNKAGHRLPSGVGFRRAWIEFQLLDEHGNAVWASGSTNSQGVILGPNPNPEIPWLQSEFTMRAGELQRHWETITSEDQVQIYEERYVNHTADSPPGVPNPPRLDTSFLGVGKTVKENRILPYGYATGYIIEQKNAAKTKARRRKWEQLLPDNCLPPKKGSIDPLDDPSYLDGSGTDEVTYRIRADQFQARPASIHVALNYQNIPPYYLRDRFATGGGSEAGAQSQRLYYLVGHLNTKGTAIEDWKIQIAETSVPVPAK